MVHIITIKREPNIFTEYLALSEPTPEQIDAAKRQNSVAWTPLSLYVDGCQKLYKNKQLPYASIRPTSWRGWIAVIGVAALTIVLAIVFTAWMLAFVAAGTAVATGLRYRRISKQKCADMAHVKQLPGQTWINLTDTKDLVSWAAKSELWHYYPACNYTIPYDELERYYGKGSTIWPNSWIGDLALVVRGSWLGITGVKTVDVAANRKQWPGIYDKLTREHSEARDRQFNHFVYSNWATSWGELAFYVIPQITSDADIVTTWELKQRIEKSAVLPGYRHADEDNALLAEKELQVAARVHAIMEVAREMQRQDALAAHEGVQALASTAFGTG